VEQGDEPRPVRPARQALVKAPGELRANTAFGITAPSRDARSSCAPESRVRSPRARSKRAPPSCASAKEASSSLASTKLAPSRFAPPRSARVRSAPFHELFSACAALKLAPPSWAPSKRAPPSAARAKIARRRSLPEKSSPSRFASLKSRRARGLFAASRASARVRSRGGGGRGGPPARRALSFAERVAGWLRAGRVDRRPGRGRELGLGQRQHAGEPHGRSCGGSFVVPQHGDAKHLVAAPRGRETSTPRELKLALVGAQNDRVEHERELAHRPPRGGRERPRREPRKAALEGAPRRGAPT
jgi:hypothetical protein